MYLIYGTRDTGDHSIANIARLFEGAQKYTSVTGQESCLIDRDKIVKLVDCNRGCEIFQIGRIRLHSENMAA